MLAFLSLAQALLFWLLSADSIGLFTKFACTADVIKSSWCLLFERTQEFLCTDFTAKVFECTKITSWQRCNADNFKAVYIIVYYAEVAAIQYNQTE